MVILRVSTMLVPNVSSGKISAAALTWQQFELAKEYVDAPSRNNRISDIQGMAQGKWLQIHRDASSTTEQ